MTRSYMTLLFTSLIALAFITGCRATPETHEQKQSLRQESQSMLTKMKAQDDALDDFLSRSFGYAIFPSVGKGGLIVGGAYGRGEVYRQGQFIGYADMTQATVGAQAGGQEFAELIVFENENALRRFQDDQYAVSANASAVIIKKGAAATARYENGVAIFTMPKGGAMVEASIGGQKFDFTPVGVGSTTQPSADRDTDRDHDRNVNVDVDVDKQ